MIYNTEFERKVEGKIIHLGGSVLKIDFFKLLNNDGKKIFYSKLIRCLGT